MKIKQMTMLESERPNKHRYQRLTMKVGGRNNDREKWHENSNSILEDEKRKWHFNTMESYWNGQIYSELTTNAIEGRKEWRKKRKHTMKRGVSVCVWRVKGYTVLANAYRIVTYTNVNLAFKYHCK